jgi:hypothetical protein
MNALQAFLLYFLDRKQEISEQLKKLGPLTKSFEPLSANVMNRINSQPFVAARFKSSNPRRSSVQARRASAERVFLKAMNNSDDTIDAIEQIDSLHINRKNSNLEWNTKEPYSTLIVQQKKIRKPNSPSQLLLLMMMCEIFIFHSLLILQNADEECKELYRNEFFLLVK